MRIKSIKEGLSSPALVWKNSNDTIEQNKTTFASIVILKCIFLELIRLSDVSCPRHGAMKDKFENEEAYLRAVVTNSLLW